MTQYLPPNLLALFAPRDPLPFLPPPDKLPHEKKTRGYLGVGNFLSHFEDPGETPPPTRVETREERLERRRKEKAEQVAYKLEREIAIWDPTQLQDATEDPFKTLFVARINYDTSESKLRREFEVYGPIKKIVLVHNIDTGKPRGYAFIEYEHERDMHSAYKHADGKKIDGKRVLVDVERSRTVKGWLPRRLGGGLGGTRRGGPDVNIKHSGREDNDRERERYQRMERERDDYRRDYRPDARRRERSPKIRDRQRSRSRERKRSRSRDSYRDSRRDREREKKRKRSKSRDRERKRDKRDKRDKSRDREKKERKERKPEYGEIKIKEEPIDDDYPDYNSRIYSGYAEVKYEDGEEQKYRPQENNGQYGHNDDDYDDSRY